MPRGPGLSSFRSRLELHPVPPSEGLVEILADLHTRRPGSALGEMHTGSLLVASARLLGKARFLRLAGGTPARSAGAALEVLRSTGDRS